jgi:hypothetical protein
MGRMREMREINLILPPASYLLPLPPLTHPIPSTEK